MINGNVIDHTFQQSDTVNEADIETRDVKYLYNNRGEWWFSDPKTPSDRFTVSKNTIGDDTQFLKENEIVKTTVFNEEIVGITLPIKIQFEVIEAPPNIKGSTASGGTKPVTIETGATIITPMFIEDRRKH